MSTELIAERDFVVADQERFATISGDFNPMHMDALAARRTLAGFPVVHGIHTLLWGLESLFLLGQGLSVASIKVSFNKMIYVGDHVQLLVSRRDETGISLSVVVNSTQAMSVRVNLGNPQCVDQPVPESSGEFLKHEPAHELVKPEELSFDQMIEKHGRVSFSSTRSADVSRMFPAAVAALEVQRVVWLAHASYLVGMICPGLHSLFGGMNLFTNVLIGNDHNSLQFRVTSSDIRLRLIKMAVSGSGWTGSIDAHARPAPTSQAALSGVKAKVARGEFNGTSVLVVGGSRGLGELTAKIFAAGGAHVTISYFVGESDALRVQGEIVASGCECDVIKYDVLSSPEVQLDRLRIIPQQMYYFATPQIFRRKESEINLERLGEFISFYVSGFYNICRELRRRSHTEISIFYPSSIAVDARPAGVTEYTMAKAAGEVLCVDMQSNLGRPGPILVRRLPRLATDQTATIFEVEQVDPIEVLLPIIREVHGRHLAHLKIA